MFYGLDIGDSLAQEMDSWISKDSLTLPQVLRVLEENPDLQSEESEEFTSRQLLILLESGNYEALEREFREDERGMNLKSFLWLLERSIDYFQDSKYELIMGLTKMFDEIDLNGESRVSWESFLDFGVMVSMARQADSNLKTSPEELLSNAYSENGIKFQFDPVCRDCTRHPNPLAQLCVDQATNKIYAREEKAKQVLIYGPELGAVQGRYSLDEQVLYICVSPHNQLAITTSNRKLIVVATDTLKKKYETSSSVVLLGVWWLQKGMWAAAALDGSIRLAAPKDSAFRVIITGHKNRVSQVLEIRHPHCICSAGMDGLILLWDPFSYEKLAELYDPADEFNGVAGLDFCDSWGHFLVSWNFSTKINVWCPQISLTQGLMAKITGHVHRVVGCRFSDPSPNLISIDQRECMKLWDIRTLNCLQILSAEHHSLVTCLAFSRVLQRVFYGGKSVKSLNHPKPQRMSEKDRFIVPILGTLVSVKNRQAYLLTNTDFRVVDLHNGRLDFVHIERQGQAMLQLTAFQLVKNDHKLIVGTQSGKLLEFIPSTRRVGLKFDLQEYLTGQYQPPFEITYLKYYQVMGVRVVFVALRNSLVVGMDVSGRKPRVARIFEGNRSSVTTLHYDAHLCLLLTGDQLGCISVWQLNSCKHECKIRLTDILPSQNPEICSIVSIPKWKGVAVSLKQGQVVFLAFLDNLTKLQPAAVIDCSDISKSISGAYFFQAGSVELGGFDKSAACAPIIRLQKSQFQAFVPRQAKKSEVMMIGGLNSMAVVDVSQLILQSGSFLSKKAQKLKPLSLAKVDILKSRTHFNSISACKVLVCSCQAVTLTRFNPHEEGLGSFTLISEHGLVATTSLTRSMKMWSLNGQLYSHLECTQMKVKSWKPPLNWVEIALQQFEPVIALVEKIQNIRLSQQQIQTVKAQFLNNRFIKRQVKSRPVFTPSLGQSKFTRSVELAQQMQDLQERTSPSLKNSSYSKMYKQLDEFLEAPSKVKASGSNNLLQSFFNKLEEEEVERTKVRKQSKSSNMATGPTELKGMRSMLQAFRKRD